MSDGKIALLAGGTGLIGSQLLPLLRAQQKYRKVIVVGRQPSGFGDAKIENVVVDFENLASQASILRADDVFCCLGTTMRKAKTREAFRRVDYQYPLELAKIAKAQGARQFFLVSAVGANRRSTFFYNRVKGETEDAISSVGFQGIHLYRPSLLLGPRKERRPGEAIGKVVYTVFGFLLPARLKAIDAVKVARAMIAHSEKQERGIFFHDSGELQGY